MMGQTRRIVMLALFLALATIIHTLESLLPVSILWFRFGFANILTVTALYLFGFRDAFIITIGRVFLGSLISGAFGSPAFILSFCGAVFALVSMQLFKLAGDKIFSVIGVSVAGALAHNVGQLITAYLLIIKNTGVFVLLPFMIFSALGTGILNGFASRFLLFKLKTVEHYPLEYESRPD
jgi:heptaprenyl diphosphate synthase